MRPRFQVRTGVLRHEPSIDFQSALAARLDGIPDPEVLQLAMAQGRILISHDENSMPGHFSDLLKGGGHSPGVLIAPLGASVGRVIESILLVWIESDASEWIDRIAWLPI